VVDQVLLLDEAPDPKPRPARGPAFRRWPVLAAVGAVILVLVGTLSVLRNQDGPP